MKTILIFGLSILIVFGLKAQQLKPTIIPAPVKLVTTEGYYKINSNMPIVFKGFEKTPQRLKTFALKMLKLKDNKGVNPKVNTGMAITLDRALQIPDEGYSLNIDSKGI